MPIDYSDEPKFSIKNVSAQTGILPVTLRAWERRYELLTPHRSQNRYRLYSERDLAILRWIKSRVDAGSSISSAVQELRQMLRNGIFPETSSPAPTTLPVQSNIPPQQFAKQLYQAFISHDEMRAGDLMREAQAAFDLNTFFFKVITPAMIELGEAWFYGKIRATTEHFASAIVRGRLLTLFQTFPIRRNSAYILLGCAPTEQHELSSLMFATLLRSAGYRVEYLGPDIPVDDLVDYAAEVRPDLVILNATLENAALELVGVQDRLNRLRSSPIFGFGGSTFNLKPELRKKVGGVFLGETIDHALVEVARLVQEQKERKGRRSQPE